MSDELDRKGSRAADLKAQILAADDRPFEDLDIEEWGVKIRVRGMTGTERDAYEAKAVKLNQGGKDLEVQLRDFRSRLVVKCLYDPETNERIFADDEAAQLGAKAGKVIDRLFDVAQELSGMTEGAVARAEGNFGIVLNDGSITG
jgi:hypothetical protein